MCHYRAFVPLPPLPLPLGLSLCHVSFDEISFVLGLGWEGLPSSVCVGGISLALGETRT